MFRPRANPLDQHAPYVRVVGRERGDGIEVERQARTRPLSAIDKAVAQAAGFKDRSGALIPALCHRHAHTLVACVNGRTQLLGEMRFRGEQMTWGWWFPHYAILVDPQGRPADEQEAKCAWANEQGCLYFACQTNTDRIGRIDIQRLGRDAAQWLKELRAAGDARAA